MLKESHLLQRFLRRNGEPCHAASLRFASSVTFVDTSLTTASALWWCRLCIQDSTMATSSWSGFLFIYSGACNLSSTLCMLVWYFDYVVTTMSQTPWQLCTGCVYHNVLTSRWLSCVSGTTWFRATIPESAGSYRRPAQTSPSTASIVKPTASATIPAKNCQSTDNFPVAASFL